MHEHLQSVENPADVDRQSVARSHPGRGIGMTRRISVQFEPGPWAASGARNALLALNGVVDEERLEEVRLLVSELVTNSVRHSDGPGDGLVNLDVSVSGRSLRVEVADSGRGFEPQPRDDDRSRPGGWGLYLVDELADRWGVSHDGLTRVWFEMNHESAAQERLLAS
jgi:anti-sigma regulatory factor (Ser/Thr protein kinase)